jgi:arginase
VDAVGSDMVTSRMVILEAPSALGLRAKGVEGLPAALLQAGLAERVHPRRVEVLLPPHAEPGDAGAAIRNAAAIAAYTIQLAGAVESCLERDECPVVLGGDCSVLLGPLLALRRHGRHGLLFLDGHADFYQSEANVTGEAASSELAFATGRGPDILTTFDGLRPLVRDEDVAVLGPRDRAEAKRYGSQPLPDSMLVLEFDDVRRIGIGDAATAALSRVARPQLDGFWIHFDVDVLDDDLMPAVDYRLPGGLSWEEVGAVLAAAKASGRALGIDVIIFNPRLDPSGGLARALVELLAGTLMP